MGTPQAGCYHPRVNVAPSGTHLPPEFVARMRALLGPEDASALVEVLGRPADVGLRLNTLRGQPEDLLAKLPWHLEAVPWCPTAYVVSAAAPQAGAPTGTDEATPLSPGRHPYQLTGAYYLQDPAATAVAEALAPVPGELVLDLAAAPGGKSTHLAALMGGQGWLVANDVHPQRAQALVGNLERCGVGNATVTSETPARLAQAWPGLFDRVLLDAPCSGEGMFRKSEDALAMWSLENVQHCAARQGDLLREAARLVKPGGYLAYSTCTFAPEENERAVARFLTESGFQIVPLNLPGTQPGRPDWADDVVPRPELAGAARVWPHRAPGEGHFVALLRRPETPNVAAPAPGAQRHGKRRRGRGADGPAAPSRQAVEAWREFAEGALAEGWAEALAPTAVSGAWLLHVPERDLPGGALPQAGLRVLRHGLQLGRLHESPRSVRIEPAHALAMWLPPGAALQRLSLASASELLVRFVAGLEVEAPGAPGYLRVEVDGLPLGWGKRSGNVVRSLLPKGLRQAA